uniref:DUF4283 domain-containing protein n=1 Tax=Cajanus cajan TaxID=3821 RepID=A0A151U494_CAJCA|nr:hypothetical protein KK1_006715 [Cajanus cajan]
MLLDREENTHNNDEGKNGEVWQPRCGVSIREIELGLFLFQFYHTLDIQRILKLGPWSFNRYLLILGIIKDGDIPSQIPLFKVPFWIQIDNVSMGFYSQIVGQNLGNHIDEFLDYDVKNTQQFWRTYMRLRVLIDVRHTLKKSKRIKKQGGEAIEVIFKYECLGPYCFFYRLLGHLDDNCERLFSMPHDDGKRS